MAQRNGVGNLLNIMHALILTQEFYIYIYITRLIDGKPKTKFTSAILDEKKLKKPHKICAQSTQSNCYLLRLNHQDKQTTKTKRPEDRR